MSSSSGNSTAYNCDADVVVAAGNSEYDGEKRQYAHNKIVIDEIDLNSSHSTYRREMANVYQQLMRPLFKDTLYENCIACQIEDPSQLHHELCLMMDPKDQVNHIFWQLFAKVDEYQANEKCFDRIIKDAVLTPINDRDVYLSKEKLYNDSEWIQLLKDNLTINIMMGIHVNNLTEELIL